MTKIRGILAIIISLVIGTPSFGQKYSRLLNIGYSGGITFGGVNNFINNKNLDGLTIDGRYFINDNVSIGLTTGWSSFSEKIDRKVYPVENGEISAVQNRYFRSVPLLFTSHYYLAKEGAKVVPYFGAGLGPYLITYEKWYGTIPDAKSKWTIGIRPEAGINVPISEKVGVNANIRYNYAIYSYNEINNLNYVEAMLGLSLYFW